MQSRGIGNRKWRARILLQVQQPRPGLLAFALVALGGIPNNLPPLPELLRTTRSKKGDGSTEVLFTVLLVLGMAHCQCIAAYGKILRIGPLAATFRMTSTTKNSEDDLTRQCGTQSCRKHIAIYPREADAEPGLGLCPFFYHQALGG
jgi:hypothetical protein